MRLSLAFAAAQSLGLFLLDSSHAFSPALATVSSLGRRPTTQQSTTSSLNLVSTPGDDDDEDLPTKDIEGAELSDEMKEKMKQARDEDERFGGGTKFKELLAAAETRGKITGDGDYDGAIPPLKNPFVDNPFAGIPGLDPEVTPATEPAPASSLNPDELTVEQQAELFRKMMAQGGPPAAPVAAVPPPTTKQPQNPEKKTGRNRDADTIQNTADVYFAQLKRDSTVRGVARLRGDEDFANSVFQDEKIKELEDIITKNPHLAEKREEEKKLIETAAEEMIAYQHAQEAKVGPKTESGVSYKQKLEEMKKKRGGGGGSRADTSSTTVGVDDVAEQAKLAEAEEKMRLEAEAAAAVAAAKAAEEAKLEEQKRIEAEMAALEEQKRVEAAALEEQKRIEAAALEEQKRIEVAAAAKTAEQAKLAEQQKRAEAEAAFLEEHKRVEAEAAAKAAAAAAQSTSPTVTASSSNEEIQKSVRTLMGLILKHRGGPGFGAGGLKGAEIGQYEQLMKDVTALLKDESMQHQATVQDSPPATQGATAGLSTVPSSPSTFAQIDSMLSCIDGAILMYRNSPPDLKEGVLFSIRAALLSAVNTCNKMMGQDEGIPSNPSSSGGNVDSMLACVEGAMQMYRNSPPELQGGVLMTLRAALLSAVNTCNKIIAENDVDNFQKYKESTEGMSSPPDTPKPMQFYDVVQVPDAVGATEMPPPTESSRAAPAPSGLDENSKILEDIYNKLSSAAGDGKMGLREDLSAYEASELADGIAEMRSIMMDELENGIPEPVATAASSSASKDSEPTVSLYQQMLAKAKAEKK